MRIIILLLSLLFVSNTYSEDLKKCPTVNMIKLIGLSHNLIQDSNGRWYAGRTSQYYGTKEKWTFVIGEINAKNKIDAYSKAIQALLSLTYQSGPMRAPSDKWLCLYHNNKGYPAGAITPPISTLRIE